MRSHEIRSRPGFVYFDALCAIIVLTILAATLALATNREQRAIHAMDDSRAASRLAESTLASLQAGQSIEASRDPTTLVSVRTIDSANDLPGKIWVSVRATFKGHSAEIIGLAPRGAVPATPGGGQ
jgi:Tfp pilus assembly protein PilX